MTHAEALGILANHPHIERYRELTSDDFRDSRLRDMWRVEVVSIATGEPKPVEAVSTASPSPPDPWLPLIRACDDHNPACCSNPAPWCSRFNLVPTRERCIECLTADGKVPA